MSNLLSKFVAGARAERIEEDVYTCTQAPRSMSIAKVRYEKVRLFSPRSTRNGRDYISVNHDENDRRVNNGRTSLGMFESSVTLIRIAAMSRALIK